MSEIFSRAFVFGFLLAYAVLTVGLLFWNLGRWLRGLGKKAPWRAMLRQLSLSRFFNPPYDAY